MSKRMLEFHVSQQLKKLNIVNFQVGNKKLEEFISRDYDFATILFELMDHFFILIFKRIEQRRA